MEDNLGIYEGVSKVQRAVQTGMIDKVGIYETPRYDEAPFKNEVQTVIRQGKEPSLWDRFWKIFEPSQEIQKARATVIMNLSESTGIAPHKFDPSYIDSMEEGFDNSIIGLLKNQKIPKPPDKEVIDQLPFAKRIAMQASAMAGDLPFMITGALIGSAGGPETAMGGAFALPMGLRKVLMDRYSKGEIKDSSEFLDRLWGATWATLKGEAIGITTGMAGKLAPIPVMGIPIETATMTVVANALDGKIPEAQEFIDTALIIGGLRISTNIAGKLRNIYAKIGRRPIEVLHDIEQDPSIKNDIINPDREIPRVYEKLKEEEINAQPIGKDIPKIISPIKEPEVQIEERTFTTQNAAQKDMISEGLSEETHRIVHGADDEWRIMPNESKFFTTSEISEKVAKTELPSIRISKALGKENQPEVLEKLGVKTEETKIEQIVKDAVTQNLAVAKALEKRGEIDLARQAREEAINNAATIKVADGPTATKAVNEALRGVGKPETLAEGKLPSTTLEEKRSLAQFTKEYKETMGEAGFLKTGVDKESGVKVVEVGNKDISKLEFPLGPLQIADRHPFIAPIIKANIKAEQNTNHWILRYSDRIKNAFDKVEKPGILMKILGRSTTNIRDVDLMIEGKKPIPQEYTGFVDEMKDILGDIKGEIINKIKNDFSESLTPTQQKYLTWKRAGEVGEEPKIIVSAFKYTNKKGKVISIGEHEKPMLKVTKEAVDEALREFTEMEKWGIEDYFPHIFKGRYKYLDAETGGIIEGGSTAKQAKARFEEKVSNNPDMKDKTYIFVNDFYDLATVRKTLNPNLVNPLEYLGTRLSMKEFFRLIGKTENLIKTELENAGVDNVKGVKVDMSGIASMQKGIKFGAHFLKRTTEMRGEEADPFRAMMAYIFSTGRKLGLEDAKMASYSLADSLPANMQNTKTYIKMQADNMVGRYNIVDSIFDETIGARLGLKPFGATRLISKGMGVEAKLKLGYAPVKTMINRVGGVFHIILQEGVKNYIEGKKLLISKDPYLIGRLETEGHLAGMEQLFAGEKLIGISKEQVEIWRPLGSYQKAEIHNRSEALAAAYVAGLKKFNGDKDAAWIYAIDSAQLTQGLYNIAAKPVIVRGPILGASYQFKQYLTNEIRFMSQLTPEQWAGYIAGITAIAGTRGALLTIKSIIGISLIGMGIDNLAEKLNRKKPYLHRGLFGFIGIDVSAPASWQIPTQLKDWMGTFPNDIYSTGEMIIKGLRKKGWTDEDIHDYVKQITPVGYNLFKGFQMLTEGQTKEGSKVIYKGDKFEGVFNFMGARTVKQSQASDSVRYMNQHRTLLIEKTQVVEDRLFGSKTQEDIQDAFNELVELRNIQTSEEMNDLIRGLQKSAQMRQLTEEARIFLSLPKSLKKEEIEKRQP